MIAKVIGQGATREKAIDALSEALDRLHCRRAAIECALPFSLPCWTSPISAKGAIHTGYIAEHFPDGFTGTAPKESQVATPSSRRLLWSIPCLWNARGAHSRSASDARPAGLAPA